MNLLLLAVLQGSAPLPDIELDATVRARSLTIEKRGEASLTLTTEPQGRNVIDVQAPPASGSKRIGNPVIRLRAEARIADPLQATARHETSRQD